jgi:putative transposase
VTARGVAAETIFLDAHDYLAFGALLRATLDRYELWGRAWCPMGTHYHLVAQGSRNRLSRGLHRLNGRYAQRFNKRHDRRGHLFADRFASWLIETDEHLAAACRYVLLNPVRAGLCATASEWPWSGPEDLKARC